MSGMNNTNLNNNEEELLKQIETLKKTIKVQNDTINRLMEAYVFNKKIVRRTIAPTVEKEEE